jgi:hypothetical protein
MQGFHTFPSSSCINSKLFPLLHAGILYFSLFFMQGFHTLPSFSCRDSILFPLLHVGIPYFSLFFMPGFHTFPSFSCRDSILFPLFHAGIPYFSSSYSCRNLVSPFFFKHLLLRYFSIFPVTLPEPLS